MRFKPYKQELREKSLIKYKGVPPSIEKVKEILKQSNLSQDAFEITYGIADKTIERYIGGKRGLPTVYWHIFYEFNNLEKFYRNFKAKKIQKQKEVVKSSPPIAEKNKSLIDAYRTKLSER